MSYNIFKYLKTLLFICGLICPSISAGLNIVSSIAPLNALADGVARGISTSTLLIPPQAAHHHYSLKPSNARALQDAQVVIWIGPSLETFLQKSLANLAASTKVITIEKLPKLTVYPVRNIPDWDNHSHHAHDNAAIDPHVWLDPQNAIIIVNALAASFSQIDSANAKIYQANAQSMINSIAALDKKLTTELASVKSIPFLVLHDGYQYFEKHYALNAKGAVAIDSELPPSAQRLRQLHQQITDEKIKCLFAEPNTSSAMIATLQRDTKIKIGELDSMGKGHKFADYLALLQYDADQLHACLM